MKWPMSFTYSYLTYNVLCRDEVDTKQYIFLSRSAKVAFEICYFITTFHPRLFSQCFFLCIWCYILIVCIKGRENFACVTRTVTFVNITEWSFQNVKNCCFYFLSVVSVMYNFGRVYNNIHVAYLNDLIEFNIQHYCCFTARKSWTHVLVFSGCSGFLSQSKGMQWVGLG